MLTSLFERGGAQGWVATRACAVLTFWLSDFPNAGPEEFVFPRFNVGVSGNKRSPIFCNVDPKRMATTMTIAESTAD